MVVSLKDINLISKKVIDVPGGNVLRGIKSGDKNFHGFGEMYFSFAKHNYIKAWKKHSKMHMNLFVPVGKIRFVFAEYVDSKFTFLKIELSTDNHSVLSVPPGLWFGFMGISKVDSMLVNVSNIAHEPNEVKRLDIDKIKYDWEVNK